MPHNSPDPHYSPPSIDYHKRSYAKAIYEGSSSDSSYSSSTNSPVHKSPLSLDNEVVLVRRFFHDNWQKIIRNLKKQTEKEFTYIPFHSEKALVNFKEPIPANLLCQNRGWSMVGKYFVKFEKWSYSLHASPKLIPSYGGWTTFREISLYMWNMTTFQQIEKLCWGFIKIVDETKEDSNLIEAKIKVKYHYSGFLLANIKIFDEEGNKFIIQIVTHFDRKWLTERDVHLHGTFKRQAATTFDEFKPDSEQFFFDGNEAISSEFLNSGSQRDSKLKIKIVALKFIIIINDKEATSSKEDKLKSKTLNEDGMDADELRPLKIHNDGALDKGKRKVEHICWKGYFIYSAKFKKEIDLGDLPHMEANKHLEDPFSSDNAEVIDITNTDVIPETPDIKPSSP
ncbi:hypothetical protein E5676_scaffold1121G00580 [Cucumis melo var. makuwa]|uniref:Uncharacterized protein n=1 Tax=Cucumis melo var. makuwa TaxID=1194695 RepID=A0A5D3CTA3_CUCMM|nr:hypothetical protein E6C27_scaffold2487G00040 [Cucumis melo var. makuwa]TYK14264.1 hypothetical protein E5676_scaffold1121G00580 [Cucumis melo var. makuwa]